MPHEPGRNAVRLRNVSASREEKFSIRLLTEDEKTMCLSGYNVTDPNHSKVEWVLLNAPLLLDAARSSSLMWRKAQKKYAGFEKRSQGGLSRLFRRIDEAVNLSYKELELGNISSAGKILEEFNNFGIGVYDLDRLSEAMKEIKEFQATCENGDAYECHPISDGILYLRIWIDRP